MSVLTTFENILTNFITFANSVNSIPMALQDSGRVPFADAVAFFKAGTTQLHINRADCDRLSDYKKYKDSLIPRTTYQYHPVVDTA